MATHTIDGTTLTGPAGAEAPVEPSQLMRAYGPRRLAIYALIAIAVGIFIAGFWNASIVDGFGRDFVAGNTVGNPTKLATSYGEDNGLGFGFLFAMVIGLAATFTACNCVVFAMIPGLACSADPAESRRGVLRIIGVMIAGVAVVSLFYGMFVGLLGPQGIAALNSTPVRRAQSTAVFTGLGIAMLVWAAIEFGFLDRWVKRISPVTRAFFAQATTKAAIMGVFVGLFSVGRPFGPFRSFLTYAAEVQNPLYGAAVMVVHGVGQMLVMLVLLLAIVLLARNRLTQWVRSRPLQPALLSALALVAGGSYFIFYWGLARSFDIGRWGFKLGIWS